MGSALATNVKGYSSAPLLLIPCGGPEALFGLSPMRVDDDRASASMASGPWLCADDGRPAAGALGVLLDDVLGQAMAVFRPDDHWPVTTELAVDFCAPLPLDGSRIHAEARVLTTDASGGLARGRAQGENGRTLAVATSRSRFLPGVPAAVTGGQRLATELEGRSGPDSLRELLGAEMRPCLESDGLVLAHRRELGNPRGVLHGGVVACAAEAAARLAVDAPALVAASLRVAYLRPAVGEVAFIPRVRHGGRSLAVVEVVACGDGGKPCALATVTLRSPEPAGPVTA